MQIEAACSFMQCVDHDVIVWDLMEIYRFPVTPQHQLSHEIEM